MMTWEGDTNWVAGQGGVAGWTGACSRRFLVDIGLVIEHPGPSGTGPNPANKERVESAERENSWTRRNWIRPRTHAMDERIESVPAVPLSPPIAALPEPLPDVTKVRPSSLCFTRESRHSTG